MYLKSGLLISTCLLGVFLAASVATGCTEGDRADGLRSGDYLASYGYASSLRRWGLNSGQFNAVEANPRDGRARRDNG